MRCRSLGLLPDAQPCPPYRGAEYGGWVEAGHWGGPSALQSSGELQGEPARPFVAGRFASFVMDETYLRATARCIERNPVRTGLATNPWDYMWSSASAHVSGQHGVPVKTRSLLQMVGNWREYLSEGPPPEDLRLLRRHESTGRPLGSEEFVRRLEEIPGRILREAKPGPRPAKKRN